MDTFRDGPLFSDTFRELPDPAHPSSSSPGHPALDAGPAAGPSDYEAALASAMRDAARCSAGCSFSCNVPVPLDPSPPVVTATAMSRLQ